jgi:hypothetical protein
MSGQGPERVVLDTNVLAIAEGMHAKATDLSRSACLELVRRVKDGLVLTVDADDRILLEYLKVLRASPKGGVGRKVAEHLYHLRNGGSVCHMVALTPTAPPPASFEEVPEMLRDFDEDDHAFIGVAAADGAPILVGLDGEWWQRRADFAENGIDVQFLCLGQLIEPEQDPG